MGKEGSLRALMDAIVFMSPCKGKVVYRRLPRPAPEAVSWVLLVN